MIDFRVSYKDNKGYSVSYRSKDGLSWERYDDEIDFWVPEDPDFLMLFLERVKDKLIEDSNKQIEKLRMVVKILIENL